MITCSSSGQGPNTIKQAEEEVSALNGKEKDEEWSGVLPINEQNPKPQSSSVSS